MDMYGFNRIIDGFRRTSQYQKWAAYYELVTDLKRNILTARRVWKERKGAYNGRVDLYTGEYPENHNWLFCQHCGIPIGYFRYHQFSDKVLCTLCYGAYQYQRPTLEHYYPGCVQCDDAATYDFKDWPTFLKDNPLDGGWHWELSGTQLLKVKGDEHWAIWHVRHPMIMRKLISAGLTPP